MDSTILTFAEIGFLLRSGAPQRLAVREQLRLQEADDTVVAAGLASLLARGLCTRAGDDVQPSPPIVAIIAALSRADKAVRALGKLGDRTAMVHIFCAAEAVVALSPAEFGQFTAELLDPGVDLADQLVRFMDACLVDGQESAVLVQDTGENGASLAIVREASGNWFVSDSLDSPDQGEPSSRQAVVSRIVELFRSGQVELTVR